MYSCLVHLRDRLKNGIERAFAEEHTPREIAGSFAAGVFIAAIPTGGTALIWFALAAYLFDRVSKLALLAAIVIFNPLVKWSIYVASFWVGTLLLGPVPGVEFSDVSELSLSAGSDILVRQLLGNFLLAGILAIVGYFVVIQLLYYHQRRSQAGSELVAAGEPGD